MSSAWFVCPAASVEEPETVIMLYGLVSLSVRWQTHVFLRTAGPAPAGDRATSTVAVARRLEHARRAPPACAR